MKALTVFAFLIPFAASAADFDCSVKASTTASKADLSAMAKVSVDAAKKSALDRVNAPGASVTKSELEVEHGCLVYSYDISVPGSTGVQEVIVDAGSGKVLKTEHESAAKEAAEKTMDKMKK
jgi:uncharacterized membrane protein YkoI